MHERDGTLPQLQRITQISKHIQLPFSLVSNGRAIFCADEELRGLGKLFSTAFAVEIEPPFLVFRVRTLPPRPWPFTVAGLPVWFTLEQYGGTFYKGELGRGAGVMNHIDLSESEATLGMIDQAIKHFKAQEITVYELTWCFGFWIIVVDDELDIRNLPFRIAGSPGFYRRVSKTAKPDPSALRNRAPQGSVYENSSYINGPSSLLRPGIMLSSSDVNGRWRSTTSGILVVDTKGGIYTTVATHGFETDRLVYHPDPRNGIVIGKINRHIPGLDVSLVKLNRGLRYTNEILGDSSSSGIVLSGISMGHPPYLQGFEKLTMNNSYSGNCEGILLGIGGRLEGVSYVTNQWVFLESGQEPVDGSCGCPLLTKNGQVAGFFSGMDPSNSACHVVAAYQLREVGLEICGGEYTF